MNERNTRQKDVIREALQGADDFISAQQLHARLEDAGEHIALATVYRQLGALADAKQVAATTTTSYACRAARRWRSILRARRGCSPWPSSMTSPSSRIRSRCSASAPIAVPHAVTPQPDTSQQA